LQDREFTEVELSRAILKAKSGRSVGDVRCPAEYYKALMVDQSTKAHLLEVVNETGARANSSMKCLLPSPPRGVVGGAMKLARAKSWRPTRSNQATASWTRHGDYKLTTTAAALASGCKVADLSHDWKKVFLRLHDPALEHGC